MPRAVAITAPVPSAAHAVERAAKAISDAGTGARAAVHRAAVRGVRGIQQALRSATGFSAILPHGSSRKAGVEQRAEGDRGLPLGAKTGVAKHRVRTTDQSNLVDGKPVAGEKRTDEELVVAHRSGDPVALRVLIDRYKGELHGFLTRLVGSRTGADDVFQEAFLQVHLAAESFDEERRFKPWLYTIAANKGRDYLRRQKRRHAASLDAPVGAAGEASLVDLIPGADLAPASGLEASDESSIVQGVVDELPTHFREILLLAYFQRMSYSQIADSLSIPLGTVKSRLHAAVASFASSWRLACARRGLPSESPAPTAKPRGPRGDRAEEVE